MASQLPAKCEKYEELNYEDPIVQFSQAVIEEGGLLGDPIPKGTGKVRKNYLKIISEGTLQEIKSKFIKVAQEIKRNIMDVKDTLEAKPIETIISLDEEKSFTIKDEVILIGRNSNCHIPLTDMYSSRIHCLIFPLDSKIIVIDPGSLMGIITTYRSSNKPLEDTSEEKQVLTFKSDESFDLNLGRHYIEIFSKKEWDKRKKSPITYNNDFDSDSDLIDCLEYDHSSIGLPSLPCYSEPSSKRSKIQ